MTSVRICIDNTSGELFYWEVMDSTLHGILQNSAYELITTRLPYLRPGHVAGFPSTVHRLEIAFNAHYYHGHVVRRNKYFISSPVTI